MTAYLIRSTVLLFSVVGPALSAGADRDAKAPSLSHEQISKYLEAGRGLLLKGIPGEAISQYFDPVIQSYAQSNQDPDVQVYSAHSLMESLIYAALTTAAADQDKNHGKHSSIIVDGAWTDALEMKAYALSELGRPDEAKIVLQQAIAVSPDYPVPWLELGSVYQTEKNWAAAMDAYQHGEDAANFLDDGAVKNEKLGRALRGKAFVLTELGRLDESEALYKRCLSINTDDDMAKHELDFIAHLRKSQEQKPPALPSNLPSTSPEAVSPTTAPTGTASGEKQ